MNGNSIEGSRTEIRRSVLLSIVRLLSFAGKGKSFPILKPGDVMAAVNEAVAPYRSRGYYQKSGFVHVDVGRVRRW